MLVQTVPPAIEPITLAAAKLHLRVDISDDDSLITALIAAARQFAESLTGRSFVTQTWQLTLDYFPICIALERGVVQRINSITYRDMSGTIQTVAFDAPASGIQRSTDGNIVADLTALPARIAPAFGRIWPIPMPEIGAVTVNYTAGYGDDAAVPEGIKRWMLLRIGSLYAFREEIVAERSIKVDPMPFFDLLLDPYRVATA
ncbi:head-tail connector protein [Burkholderia ambifaria]|uniref:head-tail connector protein n=1 Tax=Burkholderia ambifaria TaxID=152480 RepID=UPI001B8EA61B|nr:head-tail connector protein [Burkholderia ambifaria]MBR8344656.1 head-tail connector protein [Burkholderia ambifaria]